MLTLAEFYPLVRATIEDGLTSNTIASYDRAWRLRIEPTLGHLPLDQVTPLVLANARASWSGSPSTRQDAFALASGIFEWAMRERHIRDNPARSVPRAKGKAKDADPVSRALSDAQTARMLDLTADTPHAQRNLAGLVFTGLRLGELVGLRWDDLDMSARTLTVRRTVSPDGSGRLTMRPTKSGRTREVPIIDDLVPWLQPVDARHDHVFTGEKGGAFDSTNLSRAARWKTIRDQIRTFPEDQEPLHFHDLRHTFLTRMSRLGALPQQLQSVAGHASVTTTELYARTSSHEAARAIGNLANREVALPNGGDGENIIPIRSF